MIQRYTVGYDQEIDVMPDVFVSKLFCTCGR